MKFNPTMEALKRKRGQGIDLTIILGKPEDEKDDKTTDLAPEVKEEEGLEEGLEEEKEMPKEMGMSEEAISDEDEEKNIISEMMGNVSDEDMRQMKEKKRPSMGEMAKMLMAKKIGK
jgi:hypothetical protein